jgi:hypothetical protein
MSDVVSIGDKVFIGGLFGKDFDEINNKVGEVEKIVVTSTPDNNTHYFAEVNIGKFIIPVDFHYIFKLNESGVDVDLTEELNSPITHFFRKYRVVQSKLAIDALGQSLCFCITMENNVETLTLTNLN